MTVISLIDELAAEIEQLWRSPQPTMVGVRQIARRLIVEAADASTADEISLLATQEGAENRRNVLARSLNAARIVSWSCGHFLPLAYDTETTVCATLLADAGYIGSLEKTGRAVERLHPSLGGAMVARMTDVPASLPQRIARHHERADGSGFPMRLTIDQLTRADRLIALAIRFAELYDGDLRGTLHVLHAEARRGLFDPDLSANLLWSMTGVLPTGTSFDHKAPSQWAMTDLGRRRHRVDSAHGSPDRPHFQTHRRLTAESGTQSVLD